MRKLALFLLIFTLLGAVLAGIGYLWLGNAPVAGPRKKLLTLRLDTPLEDHETERGLPLPGFVSPLTLSRAYLGLSAARHDASVAGLAIYLDDAAFGLAKAQELRRQILGLREAGKRVDCYLETAGEGSNGTLEFYLASACDTVALAPAGELALLGFYADSTFLKGGLDKLKIEPSFLTAGEFKSAAEMFTEERHSPAARAALDALLDGLFALVVRDIAAGRSLDAAAVRAAIDDAPLSAERALAGKLVDHLEFPDEFRARLENTDGGDHQVSLADYARGVERRASAGGAVAVVFAQGAIVRGGGGVEPFSGELFLGAGELSRTLVELGEDESVAAVVLRVDSPGGSALASDLILREVARLKEKKPVVVSMSDVAASGGYYIAAKADKIVAEEATLTGSIGVVSGKLATGRFQEELLGVTHDPLRRGANAGLYSTLAPFDETQTAVMRRRIDDIYRRFLDHVATGRGLEPAAVLEVAEGRVWTGADARARGLVDELGGIDRAVELAREAAGLPADATPALDFYPKPATFWDWLAEQRSDRRQGAALAEHLFRAAALLPRPLLELELDPGFRALSRID
jgi:protease-4